VLAEEDIDVSDDAFHTVTTTAWELAMPALGGRERRYCPECEAAMEKHHGAINEPIMSASRRETRDRRRTRPATFWACTQCEYAEEIGR
jgi:hypothetical protein